MLFKEHLNTFKVLRARIPMKSSPYCIYGSIYVSCFYVRIENATVDITKTSAVKPTTCANFPAKICRCIISVQST